MAIKLIVVFNKLNPNGGGASITSEVIPFGHGMGQARRAEEAAEQIKKDFKLSGVSVTTSVVVHAE